MIIMYIYIYNYCNNDINIYLNKINFILCYYLKCNKYIYILCIITL